MASAFRHLVEVCRQEHQKLLQLLLRWTSTGELFRGSLSLSPAPDAPLLLAKHIHGLRLAFPGIEKPFKPGPLFVAEAAASPVDVGANATSPADVTAEPHPAEAARKRILRNLGSLGIEIIGMHGKLLETLADMVIDLQMPRTLLLRDDRFHVTGISVLAAAALANLAFLIEHPSEDVSFVDLPLEAIHLHSPVFRNGDLLFCDLAARSAMASPKSDSSAAREIRQQYAPRFLTHSTLTKLDLLFELPPAQIKAVNLRRWPGLEYLVGDSGARSLRRYTVGRLAQRCVADPRLGAVIVGCWADGLWALDDSLRWHAAGLFAAFLWELLEIDPKVLWAMATLGKPSRALLMAVGRIEASRRIAFEPWQPDAPPRQYLYDVASCLDQFDTYHALRQLSQSAGQSPIPTHGASA